MNDQGDSMNYDEISIRLTNNLPIVYPTTTQPALGCYPTNNALDYLFDLKKRPESAPVSLAVNNLEECNDIVIIDSLASEMEKYFPKGSLTFLLPAKKKMDQRLGGNLVALRPVAHPVAKELINEFGPLTATSANISGCVPSKTCLGAIEDLNLSMEALVDGECESAVPSTIVRIISGVQNSESSVIIMREGVVPSQKVTKWTLNQK